MTSTHLRTATAAATDVGRRRHGNEDSHALWVSDGSGRAHAADTLLVVCDGMGGSNAGEVASRLAVEAVVRVFESDTTGDPLEALRHAVDAANTEVHEHSRSRQDLQGMGTTCTAVAIQGDSLSFAHVGDSRAYLLRGGQLSQITSDHSLVAQLVARGQITREDARHDPRRNVVTRSVGVGPAVEIDAERLGEPLRPGDTILVCSDGLHGQLEDEEMAKLASDGSLDRACRTLIALANERGGPDNITVAIARIEGEGAEPEVVSPPPRASGDSGSAGGQEATSTGEGRSWGARLMILAAVVLLIALTTIAWYWFGSPRSRTVDAPTGSHEATTSAQEPLAQR